MPPTDTPLDWHGDFDRKLATAYWVQGERLILYAFMETDEGVIDLVAIRAETAPRAEGVDIADHVQQIIETWNIERPRRGLTSSEIRLVSPTGPLLAEARKQLRQFMGLMDSSKAVRLRRRDAVLDDTHYARLAVTYEREFVGGPGARERLANRFQITENTARDHIKEAKRRGFWMTSGSGRAGHASASAHELARETS